MARTTRRQPIETMNTATISALLERDGYDRLIGREATIKQAAARGALLWTRERLTTTDGTGIDARPERYA